jgi:uncharacterized tellurite resistance protein B-like protein
MVSVIKQFFEKYVTPPAENNNSLSEHALQLATAALFIEMMRADTKTGDDEQQAITRSLQKKFSLSNDETHALIRLAEEKVHASTGYYEFTSLINKGFTYEQKVKVVEYLWEVAFADAELDKHEEHMVRKIADLIYVKHKDFINTKLRVRDKRLSE